MKPSRLTPSPTRYRRLNEVLGLAALAAAGAATLALLTYTPADPSFNSVGAALGPHPIHNWTGLVGAYAADLLLQGFGVAAFFVPLLLLRLALCWLRSRPFGSLLARGVGLLVWLVSASTAAALLHFQPLWRQTLPLAGLCGTLLAGALLRLVNLPGAALICALGAVVALYLTTTFTISGAGPWFASHFGLLGDIATRFGRWRRSRALARQARAAAAEADYDLPQLTDAERAGLGLSEAPAAELHAAAPADSQPNRSLLGGLFGRRGRAAEAAAEPAAEPAAAAADLPTPQPSRSGSERAAFRAETAAELPTAAAHAAPAGSAAESDDWLNAPDRQAPPPLLRGLAPMPAAPAPAAASPVANPAANPGPHQPITFGQRADANQQSVILAPKSVRGFQLPPSSLLYRNTDHAEVRESALRDEARVLQAKCAEFGVDGTVEQINPGPVVTTFEFRPDAGVKVARIVGLADDLCLAMAAESILIERMAGKSTVGIQVPNSQRETIWLRDVVESESFAQSRSRLPLALGKDISGGIVTHDLASMPHVLIAGSTGSGKSVAINAMIMSVLFRSTPEQVRMILVDPKRVELGMYEGIPHLFTPIITEAKLAANALRNAVREMERRLKLLAANHVRNIDQFNKLFEHGSEYLFEDVNQEPLPYLMIVIDELADLMMLDRSNVEESITRLAQMARAVGIHLVLATQRPSVDVITGLIKANVPTRMSFRLATKVDSRTIIDANGAESLLGRGDMLFLPPGTSRLQRVHAPFVTEKEIAAVTKFWRDQGEADYATGFLEAPKEDKAEGDGSSSSSEDDDPLFDDAVRLVFEFGKASTSLLQRRLRIGYGRAAHLIDLMEKDGLVGPADGSKPREILKAPTYYAEVDAALR